jgi:glycosyltransferase involved in cell wall biosynthesis
MDKFKGLRSHLVKAFDVCLIPFVTGPATRMLSPAITLEYMAAGKPVVSTDAGDAGFRYGRVVRVARSVEGFIAAIRQALQKVDPSRLERGYAMADRSTWDNTVARMQNLAASAGRDRHQRQFLGHQARTLLSVPEVCPSAPVQQVRRAVMAF